MKISSLLLAASCRSTFSLSDTQSLHAKNVFDDKESGGTVDIINRYHEIDGFHSLNPPKHGSKMNASQRQITTEIPTFTPTAADDSGNGVFPTASPTTSQALTNPPSPPVTTSSNSPTTSTDTLAVDKTLPPTIQESNAPTLAATPTVGTNLTLAPTSDRDNHTDDNGEANWNPYTPLSSDQFSHCLTDLLFSDTNLDSRLNYTEYLSFISVNSQRYGYNLNTTSSEEATEVRLNDYPLEYAMIFHTTACMCSYFGEGEGCCLREREGVRLFFDQTDGNQTGGNQTSDGNNNGQTTGGGTTETIDVGGGEDDFLGGTVDIITDTITSNVSISTSSPSIYDDYYWDDLPSVIQSAYSVLGYNQTSWDEGFPTPESERMDWDELSDEMQDAAILIGYTQESWDNEKRRRRRLREYVTAKDIFDDVHFGGRSETRDGDGGSVRDAHVGGVEKLVSEESYTRKFCTDVYNAYKVTKSPTYAPTTYAPTPDIETMSPSMSVSEVITPAPIESRPVTNAPTISTSTSAPFASKPGSPTSMPTLSGSVNPTNTLTIKPTITQTNTPISTTTPQPTTSISTSPPTPITTTTTPTPKANTHQIYIQFGISSNCGITAYDVLNSNKNTIMDGLIVAMETLIVDMYGTGEDSGGTMRTFKGFHGTLAEMYAGLLGGDNDDEEDTSTENTLTQFYVDNGLNMVQKDSPHVGMYLEMGQNQISYNIESNTKNNKKKKKKKHRLYKQKKKSNNNNRQLSTSTDVNLHRKLAYYDPAYPIEITDVEDVVDQACPPGINCMKVYATVTVVLEEGDDPQEIEKEVKQGVVDAFSDGSFFQAIPPETIFCPSDTASPVIGGNPPPATDAPVSQPGSSAPTQFEPTTASPSVPDESTSEPTAKPTEGASTSMPSAEETEEDTESPSAGPTVSETTSAPTEGEAPTNSPSSESTAAPSPSPVVETTAPIASPTGKPTAEATEEATSAPTGEPAKEETDAPSPAPAVSEATASPVANEDTSVPSFSPTEAPTEATKSGTSSPTLESSSSSVAPSSGNATLEKLKVEVTYDIANDCGLDSQAIMNEVNNTLKSGLIAATTVTTINILNETFPREEDDATKRQLHGTRNLRHANGRYLVHLNPLHQLSKAGARHRNLVYYTDEYPVTMDNVIDVTDNCQPGKNCLLIVSTITTVLESGDDPQEVKKAIEDGIRESFVSGDFYSYIPADTVICPERRRRTKGKLVALKNGL